jgi:O-methyltransferase
MESLVQRLFNKLGYKITQLDPLIVRDRDFMWAYKRCSPYTATSLERMYGLYQAVKYIIEANIEGDFVECGVWKGGSVMMIRDTLEILDIYDRKIYLYDTFSGMTEPTENDKAISDNVHASKIKDKYSVSLTDVKDNLNILIPSAIPMKNLIFVQGKVEDTIPKIVPNKIALLRLDTDFYESTRHELTHLYPLLSSKGVLIIDDYGHFWGAKTAVDEYFEDNPVMLNRLDYTGRLVIK